jgi:hypothetical protein
MMNSAVKGLTEAVQPYFDLMYDCDVSKSHVDLAAQRLSRRENDEVDGVGIRSLACEARVAQIYRRVQRRRGFASGCRLGHVSLRESESQNQQCGVHRLSDVSQNRRDLENHLKGISSARLIAAEGSGVATLRQLIR